MTPAESGLVARLRHRAVYQDVWSPDRKLFIEAADALAASRAQIADHQTELVDLRRQLDERDASLAREKQGRMEWARRCGESRAEVERLTAGLQTYQTRLKEMAATYAAIKTKELQAEGERLLGALVMARERWANGYLDDMAECLSEIDAALTGPAPGG